ncbi:putative disease resistance RPP13-like protein 1 [Gastrolobium bilobum]|uniref:putative disease resistance RPP13-like protein 1 n=1 Tax=Gastrolobium bilobum TaxID=150636 RepID=UPI002AB07F63|nr:putative disease resistance RPP13-like protein 1 [Gastrolobium bilobum]
MEKENLVVTALLSSFFQVTFDRLFSSNLIDYFRRSKLEDVLVDKLKITVDSINKVLDEAETKQYQDTSVKEWLDEVKHAVYEADKLLDEIATDAPLKKLKAESQTAASQVRGFFSAFTANPFESRLKELLQNLDSLEKQKGKLELKEDTRASNEGGVSWKLPKRLPSTSLVGLSSTIYGRDEDREQIIKFLLSDNVNDNSVPIISIVGIGGMGKTTLAQLVYNDQSLKEQFELKAWVHVSEYFDIVGVTKAILKSFQCSADAEELNSLQLELQKTLMGKKYLLVLDDVWNENWASWEALQVPLNYGSSGSRILVTTRDKKVASAMKSTQLLPLKELKKDDCWSLFERHAFHNKNVSEHPNLESIGKKIVKKCGGLPLAIKALGNLLLIKFSQSEWVKILETDMWRLSVDSNINPTVRLSYHVLPSNLKRCFAYCSMFPKGYPFEKDELIQFWMAEGLLKCCGTDKSEEDLGDEFFNQLEYISFFQQSAGSFFVMHDLVNDLAKSVSGEFCLRIEGDLIPKLLDRVQDIPDKTRHIWCSNDIKDGDKILEHIYKCNGLRSLIWKRGARGFKICNNVQHALFSRLKYLLVLSFRYHDLSELDDEISNLKLLRYLDLSYTEIKRLPDSICVLHNLQTLKLEDCHNLTELPSDFYKLINLRHLHLEGTRIKKMPKHIGRLIHLRTLTHFVVRENGGSDIKELAKLHHLQGRLNISGLGNITDPADAAEANLKDKKHLEKLLLKFHERTESQSTSGENDDLIFEMRVLEALQPDSNLNSLTIRYYRGNSFSDWLGDSHFSNLVSMNLGGCRFCSSLPPLGLLSSLKELFISDFDEIEIIGREFYDNYSSNVPFRSLEIFEIENMPKWKEWFCPDDGECFPFLKELSIQNCPKLKSGLPQHLPYLKKLEISDCQELEASLPKTPNVGELRLDGCENILVNELPSTLKKAFISGTGVLESYLEQVLLNNASLEVLVLTDFNGPDLKCSSLDLRCCNSLRTLSFRSWYSSWWPFSLSLFTNLHSLYLNDCPQLISFPGECFPLSLSILYIRNCPKLIASREEWGLSKLHSLKDFSVTDDFENVESFPEESLLPPNINILYLENCSKLRIINKRGLLHLKSLKYLYIWNCPRVEYMPEEGLPNSLFALSICNCPFLRQRYRKEEGEHWHKISHIPSVSIW